MLAAAPAPPQAHSAPRPSPPRPPPQVWFTLQGETGKSIFKFSRSWATIFDQTRSRISKNKPQHKANVRVSCSWLGRAASAGRDQCHAGSGTRQAAALPPQSPPLPLSSQVGISLNHNMVGVQPGHGGRAAAPRTPGARAASGGGGARAAAERPIPAPAYSVLGRCQSNRAAAPLAPPPHPSTLLPLARRSATASPPSTPRAATQCMPRCTRQSSTRPSQH
jgi:hypothetical protein